MPTETTKSIFLTGAREASPFILVVGPFGLLFGVVATEAGLNVLETMTFSILVIAGAAQLTALQLMTENAPTIIVIISALAVNLRMAMYSASLAPYIGPAPLWQRALAAYFLVDQSYGLAAVKYETEPAWTVRQRMAYFFGTIAPVCPFWYLSTLAGALIGSSVPEWLALDFAMPITFIALIAPALRTRAHVAAALVSITVALGLAFLPYNLGLLVAGIAGMVTGAEVERQTMKRAAS
ncbi:AzlC family ABC transporter permease [Roseovarius sp.]|uniref:AzlC family ABC transporter permease n=1 Tax=Roseovarius sp. TaxID=1486281 RepID=UPI002610FDE4|nr:AzlC family ABC transporter permease [Roseovarius sp.]MDM8166226.1 AzlC family ABC transporter permease [Roseovarius sp.]